MKTTLIKTMRWYGDRDVLSLHELRQAGITGIVTALHHIPIGDIWSIEEIKKTKKQIEQEGLKWEVVESLPVHEKIKKRTGNYEQLIANYKQSLQNLASEGIYTVTYNFMPILDWVRTDHHFKNAAGASILKYDPVKFRIFDLFILKRPGAKDDYTESQIEEALQKYNAISNEEKSILKKSIMLGLPGSTVNFTTENLLTQLEEYKDIDASQLRKHLLLFLNEITPIAIESGIKLAIHPDDPPFSVLGLPRIVSTSEDLEYIFSNVKSNSCGLCYCTGSLGANSENDLISIFNNHKDRIHFLHLRNVKKYPDGSFIESDHLTGDVPMVAVMKSILKHTAQTNQKIPLRPDHGYLHSLEDDKPYYAGYSFIGRLKGLAELTGLEMGLLDTNSKNK